MLNASPSVLAFAGAVGLLVLVHFIASLILPPQTSRLTKFLSAFKWVGEKRWPVGRYGAAIASISKTREMVVEGYENVGEPSRNCSSLFFD